MPSGFPWYHEINRTDAEKLLQNAGKIGSFLIRNSESMPNAYVLCVYSGHDHIRLYRIFTNQRGKVYIATQHGHTADDSAHSIDFDDLGSLVEHYTMPDTGLACPLKYAVAKENNSNLADESDEEEEDEDDEDDYAITEDEQIVFHFRKKLADIQNRVDDVFKESLNRYFNKDFKKDVCLAKAGSSSLPKLQKLLLCITSELCRELDAFKSRLDILHDVFAFSDPKHEAWRSETGDQNNDVSYEGLLTRLTDCFTGIKVLQTKACKGVKDMVAQQKDKKSNKKEDKVDGPDSRKNPRIFEVTVSGSAIPRKVKMFLEVDLSGGKLIVLKSQQDARDENNTYDHRKVIQLIKYQNNMHKLGIKMGKRGVPQVKEFQFEDGKARELFCQLIQHMKNQHTKGLNLGQISVFVGTWNMGDNAPPDDFSSWMKCTGSGKTRKDISLMLMPHDVYAIGTQETSTSEKEWIIKIKDSLRELLKLEYKEIASNSLWGIRLVVLVRSEHQHRISHLQQDSIKTGLGNYLGNKGGVAISFSLDGTSFCFVNCHLAARQERVLRRNQNYLDIMKGLQLGQKNGLDVTTHFHHFFWIGDLNYRIDTLAGEKVSKIIEKDNLDELREHDQLMKEIEKKTAFTGFEEAARIEFPPTYRCKIGGSTRQYSWIKKKKTGVINNTPSWCDRVLKKSFPETYIKNTSYGCTDDIVTSDHHPVFATFEVGIMSQFVPSKECPKTPQKVSANSVKIKFQNVTAKVKTISSKSKFFIEFHSCCLEGVIKSQTNKQVQVHHSAAFPDIVKASKYSYPTWIKPELPELVPMIPEREYLEDQHLIIALRSDDGGEYYGECCLSLKPLIAETPQKFKSVLTHFGEETGEIWGKAHIPLDLETTEKLYQSIRPMALDLIREVTGEEDKLPRPVSTSGHEQSALDPPQPAVRRNTGGFHLQMPAKSLRRNTQAEGSFSADNTQGKGDNHEYAMIQPVSEYAICVPSPQDAKPPTVKPRSPTKSFQDPTFPPRPVKSPIYNEEAPPVAPVLPPKRSAKPKTVEEFLKRINMEKYTEKLVNNGWDDLNFISEMSEQDLEDSGVINAFHRDTILRELENLSKR